MSDYWSSARGEGVLKGGSPRAEVRLLMLALQPSDSRPESSIAGREAVGGKTPRSVLRSSWTHDV